TTGTTPRLSHHMFHDKHFFRFTRPTEATDRRILNTTTSNDRSDELTAQELDDLRALLRQMPQTLSSEAGFPVVFDTGSTKTVSPEKLDFLGNIRKPPANIVLKGISKGLPIEGIGTVQWNFLDDDGKACHMRTEAYYVPTISLRLFSPQASLQWNRETDGSYKVRHNNSIFLWGEKRMTIPYHPHSNLPTTYGYHDHCVSQLASSLHTCVTADINQNLTSAQKLLLRWHFRLGHIGFEALQWMA
ncbi:MAG: hypothetical protein ACRDL7_07345, partial [Gaiellaceae bacterium]